MASLFLSHNAGEMPILLVVGLLLFLGIFAGRLLRAARMPALMGFMLLGLILGPSALGVISHDAMEMLGFVTEIALGFVALTIGMELNFATLGRQGKLLFRIVIWESLVTFALVGATIYLITRNLPLALLFGAVAVTTAPAGKVAVIQENRARGKLTSTLLAVVGFDDGAAIIIFGFALAVAKFLITLETGAASAPGVGALFLAPFIEIGLSIVAGGVVGYTTGQLARWLGKTRDVFVLIVASVFLLAGLAHVLAISLVFAGLVSGMVITNFQKRAVVQQIASHVSEVMPVLFVLFFALAGAHINVSLLLHLGIPGLGYIAARTAGKIGGTWIGAKTGGADAMISKYLGISILSQAGLAIGLALIALQELAPLGPAAEELARTVIITITATSIVFELVGPLLTKFSLDQAGETHRDEAR